VRSPGLNSNGFRSTNWSVLVEHVRDNELGSLARNIRSRGCYFALVKIGDKFGLIDHSGKFVVNPQFDDAGIFSEELAPTKLGVKWRYVDKSGRYAINPQFDEVGPFSDELAPAKISKQWVISIRQGSMPCHRPSIR
jgi:WG containing repeat